MSTDLGIIWGKGVVYVKILLISKAENLHIGFFLEIFLFKVKIKTFLHLM